MEPIMTVRVFLVCASPFVIRISHFKLRIAPECMSCVRTMNCFVPLQLFKKDITDGKLKVTSVVTPKWMKSQSLGISHHVSPLEFQKRFQKRLQLKVSVKVIKGTRSIWF